MFLLLIFSFAKTQQSKLQGSWIVESIKYNNGNPLEINHPLYSTFIEYEFNGNNLEINNQKFKAAIDNSTISTNFRKLNYQFESNFLVINEKGDDKIYYLLKIDDFIKKYPEFEPREIVYNNKNIFESNLVIEPSFNNVENFEDFIRNNIPSYSSTSAKNEFFQAKYILTKENKITDIQIEKSISKTFDNQFKTALLKSEQFLTNTSGKDLLVTHTFNFFKMFAGLTNKEEKQICNFIQKGNLFYEKNKFEDAITHYEKLLAMNIHPSTKDRFGYSLDQAFINLGVSYLVMKNTSKACEAFHKVGDQTNFKVRDYLLNFCK